MEKATAQNLTRSYNAIKVKVVQLCNCDSIRFLDVFATDRLSTLNRDERNKTVTFEIQTNRYVCMCECPRRYY